MSILQWRSVDVREHVEKNKPLQIVDVREPSEFASGHIPGAKSIPLGQLAHRYKEINPHTESVIVCLSGSRSGRACEFLKSAGYTKTYNLMGGMSRWDGEVE